MATAKEIEEKHQREGTPDREAIGEVLRAMQTVIVLSGMSTSPIMVTTENMIAFGIELAEHCDYMHRLQLRIAGIPSHRPPPHLRLVRAG